MVTGEKQRCRPLINLSLWRHAFLRPKIFWSCCWKSFKLGLLVNKNVIYCFGYQFLILFFVYRRKCPSPNTLSIQVPVFSNLGQSLPNLSQVSTTVSNPPSNMLLAPPKGVPPRGTSYPPPSPPLRRTPALTFNRNPPLQKIRHISGSQTSSVAVSCDNDCLTNASTWN